jgi:FdhE protein
MNPQARIDEPGQMERPRGEIRLLFLPDRDIFALRAGRLRHLSRGNTLGNYLDFLAALADAQQGALNQAPPTSPPDPHEQALCRDQRKPLLDTLSRLRDQSWRDILAMLLRRIKEASLPPATRETIAGLMQASKSVLEETADRILAGDLDGISPQELPFVAAALQVYWVHMASSLREDAFGRLEHGGLCPVCGSPPMVGIVHGGGAVQGLRYLSCSLCASAWHMVRIKCSNCESTNGISYYTLEGTNGAVKAESCSNCNSYLKLLYLGKDPQMEATADDLATLALDILMNQEGKTRKGPNLFFHPGTSS